MIRNRQEIAPSARSRSTEGSPERVESIPGRLLARLRKRAAAEKRSMNKEIIRLLDLNLPAERTHPAERHRALAVTQAEAWPRLAGRWISDVPVEDEVDGIHSARSGGREIEL